jgi:hypothetical protein
MDSGFEPDGKGVGNYVTCIHNQFSG